MWGMCFDADVFNGALYQSVVEYVIENNKVQLISPVDNVILESYNQEGLHETVLNVINVLSYNAAWDFKTESDTDTRRIIRTVISFKYNGTITAINSLNKIKIPKDVKVQVKLCT